MVSFELFVRPALLRLMGYRKTTRPLYQAIIDEDVANPDGRTYVVRVRAWREDGDVARQLHRRPGVGHPALHGGRQRPGLRPGRRPGRQGRRSRWSSFCCARISRNPDSSLNGVPLPVVSGAAPELQ